MGLTPLRNSGRCRNWLITLLLACVLLLGACAMLFSPLISHSAAHAAITMSTPEACAPTPTPTPHLGPDVHITSPDCGATFTLPATITIAADAGSTDGMATITKVDFYFTPENSGWPRTLLGTVTAPPYQITWSPPTGISGLVYLEADATDSLGRYYGTGTVIQLTSSHVQESCSVHYRLYSQWARGFSAGVTITNAGSTPFNGWTLQFTFPGDQQITQLWSGSVTQSGEAVSITNLSYNGTIAPGDSTNLGFNGTWTSNDSNPAAFTLNGSACSIS